MAVLVCEPSDYNPNTQDWQKFLYRTTLQGGGFMCLFFTNMNNTNRPKVMKGSRLEVNGSFYIVEDDEDIQVDNLINGTIYYCYAIPEPGYLFFQLSDQEPAYDPVRGGWFSGSMRAVLKVLYISNGWYEKAILDTYTAMNMNGGGGDIISRNAVHGSLLLKSGSGTWEVPLGVFNVHVVLCGGGGGGGNGGAGGNAPTTAAPANSSGSYHSSSGGGGGGGGVGGAGELLSFPISIRNGNAYTPISKGYTVGAGGGAGGNGGVTLFDTTYCALGGMAGGTGSAGGVGTSSTSSTVPGGAGGAGGAGGLSSRLPGKSGSSGSGGNSVSITYGSNSANAAGGAGGAGGSIITNSASKAGSGGAGGAGGAGGSRTYSTGNTGSAGSAGGAGGAGFIQIFW